MSPPQLVALIAVALLAIEVFAWGIGRAVAWVLSHPLPDRRRFLAEQTRLLRRLLDEPTLREDFHPLLGWQYRPGHQSATDHLSGQGLRSAREYASDPPAGTLRIAVFGDSYVYCNEVADAESWPQQIETGWRAEVLNYGVGGYGADQAFLRFREQGLTLRPRAVILGFTSMMITRMVSRYRRFQDLQDGPWFKPRFALDGDGLRLVPAPIRSPEDAEALVRKPASVTAFGVDDYWYNPAVFEHRMYRWSATYRLLGYVWPMVRRRYLRPDRIHKGGQLNPVSEAFEITRRVYRDFAAAARAAGVEPLALMLPARSEVEEFAHLGTVPYASLRAAIEHLGIRVVDPVRALTSAGVPLPELFAPLGHYSARGNAVVAREIARILDLAPRSEGP